mmetsp:Transcript_126857/g.405685  ORF Transcript_126857/g.405685 Transcript_126857/m.405685 type:complete len:233 (-) Transcript_126857:292-990(-)
MLCNNGAEGLGPNVHAGAVQAAIGVGRGDSPSNNPDHGGDCSCCCRNESAAPPQADMRVPLTSPVNLRAAARAAAATVKALWPCKGASPKPVLSLSELSSTIASGISETSELTADKDSKSEDSGPLQSAPPVLMPFAACRPCTITTRPPSPPLPSRPLPMPGEVPKENVRPEPTPVGNFRRPHAREEEPARTPETLSDDPEAPTPASVITISCSSSASSCCCCSSCCPPSSC